MDLSSEDLYRVDHIYYDGCLASTTSIFNSTVRQPCGYYAYGFSHQNGPDRYHFVQLVKSPELLAMLPDSPEQLY
jgi:hypothetical protein